MKDVGLPLIASAVRCRERGRSGRVRLGSYAGRLTRPPGLARWPQPPTFAL